MEFAWAQQHYGYAPAGFLGQGLAGTPSWATGSPTACMPLVIGDIAQQHQSLLQALRSVLAGSEARHQQQPQQPSPTNLPAVNAMPPFYPATAIYPAAGLPTFAPTPSAPCPAPLPSWTCTAIAGGYPTTAAAGGQPRSTPPSMLYQVTHGCWAKPQPASMLPPHQPQAVRTAATPALPAGRRTLAFKTGQTRGILKPRVSRQALPRSGAALLLAAAACCAHDGLPLCAGGSPGGSGSFDLTAAADSTAHTYTGAVRRSGRATKPSRRRFSDDDSEEEAGRHAPKAGPKPRQAPKARARAPAKPKQAAKGPPLSEQRQATILEWATGKGPGFTFKEKLVRTLFGDNADVSKALRRLVNKGLIIKDERVKGGKTTPFIYWVAY